MLLWLKLGGALGLRHVAGAEFRWAYLMAAIVIGATLGTLAQALWAFAGTLAGRALGAEPKPSDLRLVWGGASAPQVFALILLLPLDLSIAGPATFTDARFADSVSAAWASLSISGGGCPGIVVAVSVRARHPGCHRNELPRVALLTALAGLCLLAVVGVTLGAALAAGGA